MGVRRFGKLQADRTRREQTGAIPATLVFVRGEMKVWIESRDVPCREGGRFVHRYDVVNADGRSVRPARVSPFDSGYDAREWAGPRFQIMDGVRPGRCG